MSSILDSPIIVFIVSLIAQWLAAYVGDFRGGGGPYAPMNEKTSISSKRLF